MKNKTFKNRTFLVFLFLLLLVAPGGLTLDKQIDKIAIICALGIDTTQEGVELSAQILVPKFEKGFEKNLQVATSRGKNLTSALDSLRINLGKDIGLAHLGVIVISKDFSKNNNIALTLEPMLKNRTKNSNAIIISTPNKARELLQVASQSDSANFVSLQDMLSQNNSNLLNKNASLQNFFIQYYNPESTNLLGSVNIAQNLQESTENGEEVNRALYSDAGALLLKRGEKKRYLSKEQLQNLNLLNKNFKQGTIEVDNISDEIYQEAKVTLSLQNKKISYTPKFYQGVPRLYFDLVLHLRVEQVEGSNLQKHQNFYITEYLKEQIIRQAKQNIASSFNLLKEEGVDLFSFYQLFYSYKNKEFKKYLESLNSHSDYMSKLEIFGNIKVVDEGQITLAKI